MAAARVVVVVVLVLVGSACGGGSSASDAGPPAATDAGPGASDAGRPPPGLDSGPPRVDAGSTLPSRIEGLVTDSTPSLGLESEGTVRYVRDDAAGAAVGISGPGLAFYRLAQVDYTARLALDMGCTYSAEETVSFTDPDPFGNQITIEAATGVYTITTTLTEPFPGGTTVTCPPPTAPFTQDFNAGLNVSNGTTRPVAAGHTYRGMAMVSAGGIDRLWTWDLTGLD